MAIQIHGRIKPLAKRLVHLAAEAGDEAAKLWQSRRPHDVGRAGRGSKSAFLQMDAVKKIQAATGAWPNYEALLAFQYGRFLAPGNVIFDVGAHTGLHTRNFLRAIEDAGQVVVFEPLPPQFEYLSSLFGADARVKLNQRAVGAKAGRATFVHATGSPEESGLRQRVFNKPEIAAPVEIEVIVTTLDEEAAPYPRIDFVKIDIEGGEIDCLRGAKSVLNNHRPIVSVEYGSPGYSAYGHRPETLFELASRHNYGVHDLFGNRIDNRKDWLQFCDQAYWDYFLIPRERTDIAARLTTAI